MVPDSSASAESLCLLSAGGGAGFHRFLGMRVLQKAKQRDLGRAEFQGRWALLSVHPGGTLCMGEE